MDKIDRKRAGKAYQEATKQLDKEKTEKVKALVIDTMRALDKANDERRAAVKKQQVLRQDLSDLRQGRLDKVIERHRKDKDADKVSPVTEQRLLTIINQPPINYTGGYVSGTTTGTNAFVTGSTITACWSPTLIAEAVHGTYEYDGMVRSL